LKFNPILKEKIWGGKRLREILNKEGASEKTGESWEISAYEDNISVVSNGFLKGNNLLELIEVYMGDLIGDKIFDQFGIAFPLLIKFIDSGDLLSLQVHPDDEFAFKHHGTNGKTEMWYVIHAENGAELISGFSQKVDQNRFLNLIKSGKVEEILHIEKVETGDVFFTPAGRIHAIKSGILFAEIQQTSDLTYRIYDWGRKDEKGRSRELHTNLALGAIDFSITREAKVSYENEMNRSVNLIECPYFITNIINFDTEVRKDCSLIDSFLIYMCTEGEVRILYNDDSETLKKGETVLIPAALKEITISPLQKSTLLEIYIK